MFGREPESQKAFREKFIGGCGEMADALASGASDGNIMVVRVHSAAPLIISYFYAVVAELADALL